MRLVFGIVAVLGMQLVGLAGAWADAATQAEPLGIPGLDEEVRLGRDAQGVVHINAASERDLFLAQGYAHARDRFFQMDVLRRRAAGRLAELLGQDALAEDIEARTLGMRRAAERSLSSLMPETRAALEAYAAGVNAFLAGHPLPPEYGTLQLTKAAVEPWTALDSAAVAKLFAFDLSFDLGDIERTEALLRYQAAGEEKGFDGIALFFEDLNRAAPFAPAATIPDARAAGAAAAAVLRPEAARMPRGLPSLRPGGRELLRRHLDRVGKQASGGGSRTFEGALGGSNAWVVGGRLTCSRRPILANDPHQDLQTPPLFYPIHLAAAEGDFAASGASIAGIPFVAFGHNERIAWGAVVNQFDLADVYQEEIVGDPDAPSGLSIVHLGRREPLVSIPEAFRVNRLDGGEPDSVAVVPPGTAGVPPATLVVPRRNDGPIVSLDRAAGAAISVQYVGLGATRELDGFRLLNRAKDIKEFEHALQHMDAAGLSFVYADAERSIGFLSSGEVPLREDLQKGQISGAPPFLVRDGTGGNEWLEARGGKQPASQVLRYESLPFGELPQILDPPAGYAVTANNDPLGITLDNDPLNQHRPGGGIYYLSPSFNIGIRAQRITELLRARTAAGCATADDMKAIQADVVMLDAKLLTPLIVAAFEHAGARSAPPELAGCAADPRVAEAVTRLRRWNFSAPTGLREGFDAADTAKELKRPTADEVEASVAATIYAVWRGRMLRNMIDATTDALGVPGPISQDLYMTALRHLLETNGIGKSGVDFFSLDRIDNRCRTASAASRGAAPGAAPEARRDIVILSSLAQALERLAGPDFAHAFDRSAQQADYRWGRLHRAVFLHPLGGRFTLNAVDDAFQPFGDELPGVPADGGFETVDAASHNPRANAEDEFMFDDGPEQRYVAELGRGPGTIRAETSLPGGVGGVPGSPFFANLLRGWLANETFPLGR